jgi:hypothetical protein
MLCDMFHADLIGAIGGTVLYFYERVVCCFCAALIVYSKVCSINAVTVCV